MEGHEILRHGSVFSIGSGSRGRGAQQHMLSSPANGSQHVSEDYCTAKMSRKSVSFHQFKSVKLDAVDKNIHQKAKSQDYFNIYNT